MPIQAPVWTEFLSCQICCNEFAKQKRLPISLGCGHTICRVCLSTLHNRQCPFDQTSIVTDIDSLPINHALLQLVSNTNFINAISNNNNNNNEKANNNNKNGSNSKNSSNENLKDSVNASCDNCDYFLEIFNDDSLASVRNLNQDDLKSYKHSKKCIENIALHLKSFMTNGNFCNILSKPMQRKLVTLINCQLMEEEGRIRALRAARSLGERTVTELILQHQDPQQLNSNLWAAVRSRGCQFLGPAMQEEVLKLVLLALDDGNALSRKVLVMFVVQRLETKFPQASKTSIGHVVQLLYRASCFKVSKRESDSSLMQLKEEFRCYDALRREHDAQIVQIATEAGLRIAPDQWSSLLYGDTLHKSHMQSIVDKLQTPSSFAQSVQELIIALQRTGDPANLHGLHNHFKHLSSIDATFENSKPTWQDVEKGLDAVRHVIIGVVGFVKHYNNRKLTDGNVQQVNSIGTRYKVIFCRDLNARRICPRGASCTFAHSEQELERYRAKHRRSTDSTNAVTTTSSDTTVTNTSGTVNTKKDYRQHHHHHQQQQQQQIQTQSHVQQQQHHHHNQHQQQQRHNSRIHSPMNMSSATMLHPNDDNTPSTSTTTSPMRFVAPNVPVGHDCSKLRYGAAESTSPLRGNQTPVHSLPTKQHGNHGNIHHLRPPQNASPVKVQSNGVQSIGGTTTPPRHNQNRLNIPPTNNFNSQKYTTTTATQMPIIGGSISRPTTTSSCLATNFQTQPTLNVTPTTSILTAAVNPPKYHQNNNNAVGLSAAMSGKELYNVLSSSELFSSLTLLNASNQQHQSLFSTNNNELSLTMDQYHNKWDSRSSHQQHVIQADILRLRSSNQNLCSNNDITTNYNTISSGLDVLCAPMTTSGFMFNNTLGGSCNNLNFIGNTKNCSNPYTNDMKINVLSDDSTCGHTLWHVELNEIETNLKKAVKSPTFSTSTSQRCAMPSFRDRDCFVRSDSILNDDAVSFDASSTNTSLGGGNKYGPICPMYKGHQNISTNSYNNDNNNNNTSIKTTICTSNKTSTYPNSWTLGNPQKSATSATSNANILNYLVDNEMERKNVILSKKNHLDENVVGSAVTLDCDIQRNSSPFDNFNLLESRQTRKLEQQLQQQEQTSLIYGSDIDTNLGLSALKLIGSENAQEEDDVILKEINIHKNTTISDDLLWSTKNNIKSNTFNLWDDLSVPVSLKPNKIATNTTADLDCCYDGIMRNIESNLADIVDVWPNTADENGIKMK